MGAKAKSGKLTVEDMAGGTFSITNGGVFGSLLSTPIINIPQSAILGMHGIFPRPVAVKGQVEIRPMMYIALTYDHRLIDGREAEPEVDLSLLPAGHESHVPEEVYSGWLVHVALLVGQLAEEHLPSGGDIGMRAIR